MTATIDCPCCGDDAALPDSAGLYHDGQPLICGCEGHIMCDSETPPAAYVDECDCKERP